MLSRGLSTPRSVAVMQPYVFPYLGYFALVQAAERFVFYDDVQHKPRGWIHRNRILLQGQEHLFTVPLSGSSQNALIQEVALHEPARFRTHFLRQLEQGYRRAPHSAQALGYVDEVLSVGHRHIADLAMHSVQRACALLGIEREFLRSSAAFAATRGLARDDRLIAITRASGATRYVNSAGGRELYDSETFAARGVELLFVEPALPRYAQPGAADFVPGLSIIDLLMHNPPERIRAMLAAARVLAEAVA